jgi:hypothetical protein
VGSRVPVALVIAASAALGSVACPSPPPADPRYPPRQEGCDIKIFVEIPPMPTDNIGPVMASCDDTVTDADCMRTLKDQACKLGADLIWGVDDVPSKVAGKKKLAGRAAHTKAPGNK